MYYHILFFHLSVDGYLHCFYILATVSAAAMDMGGQMFMSLLSLLLCTDLIYAFTFIYPIYVPLQLAAHPGNISCVSTTCQADTMLDSGEIHLETVAWGNEYRGKETVRS